MPKVPAAKTPLPSPVVSSANTRLSRRGSKLRMMLPEDLLVCLHALGFVNAWPDASVIAQLGQSTLRPRSLLNRSGTEPEGGYDALRAKPVLGRPATLTDDQVWWIRAIILGTPPLEWRFDVVLWTRRIVGDVIEQVYGVRFSDEAVGRMMRDRMGLSVQRPVRHALEQDPEAVRRWLVEECTQRLHRKQRSKELRSISVMKLAYAVSITQEEAGQRLILMSWSGIIQKTITRAAIAEPQQYALQSDVDHVWTMTAAALVLLMQGGFLLLEAGQLVFCGTAATVVSGAIAERMAMTGYIVLTILIATVIYPIAGHWAWGGLLNGSKEPWLAAMGFMDFAGSTVVHSVGAWSALAAIIVIGPRYGKFDENGNPTELHGHSPVLSTMGALILMVGWIGFNGGSTTSGSEGFARIVANTLVAGSVGGVTTFFLGRLHYGYNRPEFVINGLLAGLVGITAGCDVLTPQNSAIVGSAAAIGAYVFREVLERVFKLDDPL
ncbi:unnamed protein product, partial [Cyprideis torosa]